MKFNSLMRTKMFKVIAAPITVLLLLLNCSGVIYAAPKINIWHNDTDTVAVYKNIYVGSSSELGLKAEDTTVSSATWKSSNSSVMQISGNKSKATLNALKEGAVTISVSASTTDGTLTSSITSCAITRISPTVSSYTNASTPLLRGGTSSALSRGTVGSGFQFQIYGKCGNYYYGKVPDSYSFGDSIATRYVFILKSRLNIPATGLNIKAANDKLEVGVSNKLSYERLPSIANMNENILWQSSDTDIATIDSPGNITVLKVGEVTFTGKIQGTSITKNITFDAVPSSPKLSSEIIGFKDVKLKWSRADGAAGYEIERYDSASSTYKVIKDIASADTLVWRNGALKEGIKYQYRVRAYANGEDGRIYDNYSNVYNVTTNKLKLDLRTDTKAKIKWTKTSGISGYEVSRRAAKQKTAKASVKATAASYSNTGLKKSTVYYYKIRPYKTVSGKREYCSYSSELKVTTYGTTNGYFYDQVKWKKVWPGIKITSKKANTTTMDNHEIPNSRNLNKPFKSSIKYNYSTKNKKLYIHVYVKFSGAGANKKFEYYKLNKKTKKYKKTKTAKKTYKTLAKEGFIKYWSKKVAGTSYDFKKGVNFKTQVILHESGARGQRFIPVKIGVNSDEGKCDEEYWYFVRGFSRGFESDKTDKGRYRTRYGYSHTDNYMHLATQYQTAIKNKGEYKTAENGLEDYRSVAGHELGHCFGIDDGYTAHGKPKIKRVDSTKEIGKVVKKSKYYPEGVKNIMVGTRKKRAVNNDIEMALQAQGDAIKNKSYSWQSYKTFAKNKKWQYKKSVVIRLKKKKK